MKFLAVAIVSLIIGFSVPTAADAATLPFGGPILMAWPCTCSPGQYIIVGPPKGGSFVYTPPAILYAFYSIYKPGSFVLGNYTKGGQCMMYAGTGCISLKVTGMVTMVGTSK